MLSSRSIYAALKLRLVQYKILWVLLKIALMKKTTSSVAPGSFFSNFSSFATGSYCTIITQAIDMHNNLSNFSQIII